jgi:hypothetical protein
MINFVGRIFQDLIRHTAVTQFYDFTYNDDGSKTLILCNQPTLHTNSMYSSGNNLPKGSRV